jgi:H+/gluconate symporter-like permease
MEEPSNQSPQPVPVKLVLPRWLTRGLIIFFSFCLALMVVLVAILFYGRSQTADIYPPEQQRRDEEQLRSRSENANRKVQELLHPSPSPSPVQKASQGK